MTNHQSFLLYISVETMAGIVRTLDESLRFTNHTLESVKGSVDDAFGQLSSLLPNRQPMWVACHNASKTQTVEYDRLREMVDQSPNDIADNLVGFHPSSHGLASIINAAYSHHARLVLSPDDIWYCVTLGVAQHINKHAELYRSMFVDHQGKKELLVNLLDVCPDPSGERNPLVWQTGVERICKLIEKNTKGKICSMFQADFSTTDAISGVVSRVVLMGAMKEYFDYKISTSCGIPQVELKGTLEDWINLVKKTLKLHTLMALEAPINNYGVHETVSLWLDGAEDVIKGLIATYRGPITDGLRNWWGHIIDSYTTHGSGGSTTYNGWFRKLFFYNNSGELIPQDIKQRVELEDFPSGITKVPFTYENHVGTHIPMDLLAGHVGYQVKNGAVTPVMAWAVKQGELQEENGSDLNKGTFSITGFGIYN